MKYIRYTGLFIFLLLVSACQQDQNSMEEMDTMNQATSSTTSHNSIDMLQHTVYFYLHDDVTEQQKEQFESGLRELLSIEEIYKSEMGIPADTPEREVTDHSFGYSIFVWFETMEDYEIYAEHPTHLEFIEEYENLWADVKVYDTHIQNVMD